MTKNPLINALSATLYISIVAFIMSSMEKSSSNLGHSVLVPIAMLSLFVLSAAVMGYIFCYRPLQLLVDGKKLEALHLFLKTVGIFAIITVSIFSTLFIIAR